MAIILAAGSYHHWLAGEHKRSLRAQFSRPSFQLPAWAGFCLVCLGLAGTSSRIWETIIWMIFGLIGLFYGVQSGLALRHAARSSDSDGN